MYRSPLHTYKGDTQCIDAPEHYGLGPNLGNTEELPKSLIAIFTFNCTGCNSRSDIALEDNVCIRIPLVDIYLFSFQRRLFEPSFSSIECSSTILKMSFHNLPAGKNEIKPFQAKTSEEKNQAQAQNPQGLRINKGRQSIIVEKQSPQG